MYLFTYVINRNNAIYFICINCCVPLQRCDRTLRRCMKTTPWQFTKCRYLVSLGVPALWIQYILFHIDIFMRLLTVSCLRSPAQTKEAKFSKWGTTPPSPRRDHAHTNNHRDNPGSPGSPGNPGSPGSPGEPGVPAVHLKATRGRVEPLNVCFLSSLKFPLSKRDSLGSSSWNMTVIQLSEFLKEGSRGR